MCEQKVCFAEARVRLPLAACMRLYYACSVLHAHVVWKTAKLVSVEEWGLHWVQQLNINCPIRVLFSHCTMGLSLSCAQRLYTFTLTMQC
jgi:hypothetical protein